MSSPIIMIVLFFASGAAAIYGTEASRPVVLAVAKPLTTILLLFILGWPTSRFGWWIAAGVVFSLIGDVALLAGSSRAFMAGLVSFLAAHVSYTVAFVSVAAWSAWVPIAAVLVAAATALLLRRLWPGAIGLRAPVVIYGAAISTMVVTAFATVGGRLAPPAPIFAAAGAVLFFISDASLSLNKFARPIPHSAYLTLGVYWLGQLGITLAARGG